ncbi:hypothetical protein [Halorubrum sp. Eb13]|uniref:hypothetical protein n=1 Tax=Halorubrum sp. Eb13 TaxID=1383843 RepID=UPI000B9901D4|nr:hypothetical protein [Halorubrum sp. Eb13]OYR41016.1 hypothetical protein DJ75_14670 [Halorubrum sp. Eb13]
MGRTNPTYRDRLGAIEDEWGAFRRALRRADQRRFDDLFVYARDHADAAGTLNHPDPLAPVWMAILLEQERRIDELETRVEALTDGEA